jgi:GTP-binding protein
VDARRGITDGDEGLFEWAQLPLKVHVLLSKADKLTRNEAGTAMREASARLYGRASAQLFSAQNGTGVKDAQDVLAEWLG